MSKVLTLLYSAIFSVFIFANGALANTYQLGPVGGTGGNPFKFQLNAGEKIAGVYVRHGTRIDAIQFLIQDQFGNTRRSQRYGGSGGTESFFGINNNEYLSGIVVNLGTKYGRERVFGLKLAKSIYGKDPLTSKKHSPLYGTTTNIVEKVDGQVYKAVYNIPFNFSEIQGFWGRSADELDALGVIVGEEANSENKQSVVAAVGGQQGFTSGSFAFPGRFCGVDIRHANRIDGLRFKNCNTNGSSNYSSWWGGTGGSLSSFTLQSGEYIKAIKGSVILYNSDVRLSSIQFETNLRTSPTYGVQTSTPFALEIPQGLNLFAIISRYGSNINSLKIVTDPQ